MLTDRELQNLWEQHLKAAHQHQGALDYRAELADFLPAAAAKKSDQVLADLYADRTATYAIWRRAWNTVHPEAPVDNPYTVVAEAYFIPAAV